MAYITSRKAVVRLPNDARAGKKTSSVPQANACSLMAHGSMQERHPWQDKCRPPTTEGQYGNPRIRLAHAGVPNSVRTSTKTPAHPCVRPISTCLALHQSPYLSSPLVSRNHSIWPQLRQIKTVALRLAQSKSRNVRKAVLSCALDISNSLHPQCGHTTCLPATSYVQLSSMPRLNPSKNPIARPFLAESQEAVALASTIVSHPSFDKGNLHQLYPTLRYLYRVANLHRREHIQANHQIDSLIRDIAPQE